MLYKSEEAHYSHVYTCYCVYINWSALHISNLHRKKMDDSPQVESIKQNRNKIVALIQGDLILIVNDLNGVKLLSDEGYDEIVNTQGNPPLQRANNLIQRVIPQVEIDPAQYEVFCGVLEKHFKPEIVRKILPKLAGESVLYCTVCIASYRLSAWTTVISRFAVYYMWSILQRLVSAKSAHMSRWCIYMDVFFPFILVSFSTK